MNKVHLLLIGFTSLLFISCGGSNKASEASERDAKIQEAYDLIETAINAGECYAPAPLGFRLGCTTDEFEARQAQLKKELESQPKYNDYVYLSNEFGDNPHWFYVSSFPYFSDPNTQTDTIASVSFVFEDFRESYGDNKDAVMALVKELESKLFDNTWKSVEFSLKNSDETFGDYYKFWIKENVIALFNYDFRVASLEFTCAPLSSKSHYSFIIDLYQQVNNEVREQRQNESSRPTVTVRNSAWDGSVWQVEKYLKSVLKDPKSYESIEWSEVRTTSDGYKVRHKYRAKNSFGGYVISNQIFTLDRDANVISVVDI